MVGKVSRLTDLCNSWRSVVSSTFARKVDFYSDACMLINIEVQF